MDRYEVTKGLWQDVYQWAVTHGYSFDYGDSGQGKTSNHPAQMMTWYDAVKWCNARSEKENKTPAYYTDTAQTTVYRAGQINVDNSWVNWNVGLSVADGGGVGEGGAGWSERAAVSVGEYDFAQSGELLCLAIGVIRLRHQPNAVLSPDFQRWGYSLHESGGVFCTERLWAV